MPRVTRSSLVLGALLALAAGCEDDLVVSVDPLLVVSPDHLDFGTVELGQDAREAITLRNLESVAAEISSVEVEDDCGGCFLPLSPPTRIGGYVTDELQVRFRAVRLEIATGTLTITSNDPKAPSHRVTLVGRGSDTRRPDIAVVPEQLDLGFVPAGGVAVASFVIRSTGTNDLLIDRIRIEPADAPFRVTTSTPTPERPGRLAPGAQASVALRATLPATATGTVTARVIIESNVLEEKNVPGQRGWVAVPLNAKANRPPIAVAGPDQTVEPWSRVTLDGSMSYDQDDPPDDPLTYQWTMVSRPGGSQAVLERARTPQPSFWADLTGTYELQLVVTDALGLESEPARLVVEALPTNAVRIELTWNHPDSDLDLHLIREGGTFCDCGSDVHYRDCGRAPNWFPATPGANPRLDIDDRSGFGPENINIDGHGPSRFIPEGAYQIAVHYYSSNSGVSSWPTQVSVATVRVFIFGLLAAELTQDLTEDGQLWLVGNLRWPERMVVPDGRIIEGAACGVGF